VSEEEEEDGADVHVRRRTVLVDLRGGEEADKRSVYV